MPYTDDYTGPAEDQGLPTQEKVKSPWGEEFDPLGPGFLGDHKAPDGAVWRFNPNNQQWEMTSPAPAPAGTGTGGDGTGGTGTGGTGTGGTGTTGTGNLLGLDPGTFTTPATRFPGATGTGVPETPVFTPPGYDKPPAFDYGDFTAPTAEEVLNDPGYRFSRDEGERALKAGYASGGVLNTGGTMKDILKWGGDYAFTRAGDVLNRKLNVYNTNRAGAVQKYNTNYGTQYQDPYSIAYQGATASFAPKMTGYGTQASANQRANEWDYENAYQQFQDDYQRRLTERNRRLDENYRWTALD